MKKLLVSFISLLLLFTVAVPAFAATNTDAILDSLHSGVVVNGKTVEIPVNYINQAENYFASHKITDAQANYILAQINAAKKSIQAAGITDLSKMNASTKQQIITDAQSAANNIALKLTIGADKKVKIADSNGIVVFSGGDPIKTTGLQIDFIAYFMPTAFLLIGIAVVCGSLIYKNKLLESVD